MGWIPIVGKRFTAREFDRYVGGLEIPRKTFLPQERSKILAPVAVTLHHTWRPDLKDWRKDLWREHLASLETFYRHKKPKPWNSGPHLFIDDEWIYVFTPLWARGVHSPSFNDDSWGIEMIGDFGGEPPAGHPIPPKQLELVADALVTLYRKLGVEPSESTLRFHRDDPETDKNCPGAFVRKEDILNVVRTFLHSAERPVVVNDTDHIPSLVCDSRTYVEARPFMAAIGGAVSYEKGQIAVVRKGSRFFFARGTYKTATGRAYLPVAILADRFGLSLEWRDDPHNPLGSRLLVFTR